MILHGNHTVPVVGTVKCLLEKCAGKPPDREKTTAVIGQRDGIAVLIADPRQIAVEVKVVFHACFGHQGECLSTVMEIIAEVLVSQEDVGIRLGSPVLAFVALTIQEHHDIGVKQAAHLLVVVQVPPIAESAVVLTLTAVGPDNIHRQHASGERQVRDGQPELAVR